MHLAPGPELEPTHGVELEVDMPPSGTSVQWPVCPNMGLLGTPGDVQVPAATWDQDPDPTKELEGGREGLPGRGPDGRWRTLP